MKNGLRRVLGRRTSLLVGLAAAVAAPLVFPGSALAQYVSAGAAVVPGNPLVSFDISWVDPTINTYLLADRSNQAIDVIPLQANPPVFQLVPTGPNAFAGAAGGNNSLAGPNGIITLIDPPNTPVQLFVGDGPTPVCGGNCSTVKVFTAAGGATPTHVISTGGSARADELCWAPPNPAVGRTNGLVEIANDADTPPFISFIPTAGPSAYSVVQKISVSGASNGIEQCVYDPTTDTIFLNIPEVSGPGNDTQPGAIVEIDPTTMSVIGAFEVNISFCAGPQGMALGSRAAPLVPGSGGDGQILLGCNAPSVGGPIAGQMNTISINDITGDIVSIYENLGGNDEVYHTETPAVIPNGDWFLAGGSFTPVEQVVAVSPFVASGIENPSPAIITLIPTGFPGGTTRRTHSVASWAGNAGAGLGLLEAAIFPVPADGGGSPGFSSTLCTTAAAQGCIAFFLQSPITE